MRRFLLVTSTVTCLLAAPTAAMAAEEVTVGELIEFAEGFAGADVDVEGELVGDYGFRNDGWMWTQLNGDSYARKPIREGGLPVGANTGIGVRMPAELAQSLDPPGGYRTRGPLVRLTGVWKYHDPDRQGESYLEVQSLTVIESGRQIDEEANSTAIIIGILLVAGAAALWLLTPTDE